MISPRIKPFTFFHEEAPDDLFLLRQCQGDILLGPAGLYETLRGQGGAGSGAGGALRPAA